MKYNELKELYNNRICLNFNILPCSAFDVATHLNLRVKNSLQCKEDYGENYPLMTCNACLSLVDGEYIIYHDEKYPYKNFAIAHEIAHYLLGHTTDGIDYHHDAQLLAAIIVVPIELLKKSNIKTSTQLSEQCKIPIDVAENYWADIQGDLHIDSFNNKVFKYIILTTTISVISFYVGLLANPNINHNLKDNTESRELITTIYPNSEPDIDRIGQTSKDMENSSMNMDEIVMITKTGEKYHKEDCQYIVGHEVTSVSISEAIKMGYEPCQICFN